MVPLTEWKVDESFRSYLCIELEQDNTSPCLTLFCVVEECLKRSGIEEIRVKDYRVHTSVGVQEQTEKGDFSMPYWVKS